jgi:hypothetical protein
MLARRYAATIGICLVIGLAGSALAGWAAPQTIRDWPIASSTTAAGAPAEPSATVVLGVLGFSGLALFNRRLRLAGLGRDVSPSENTRR